MGRGGVDEHQAGDLVGVVGREGERVEAPEGVAGHDVRAHDTGPVEQGVQVGRDREGILGTVGVLAPAPARTVVDADRRVALDALRDPAEVGGHLAATGLDDHGGAAGSAAAEVQAVPADVDQATRHRRRRRHRRADGLVGAADAGEAHGSDHRVEQPARDPAGHVATDPHGHPERECEQDRRPDPVDRGVGRGPESQQGDAACAQHQGGHRGPAPRLRTEPRREPGQDGPADREAAQDRTGESTLGGGHDGCCGQGEGGDEPGHQ